MNVHFAQVARKSQLFSYLLAAFAIFTVLMFALSLSRHVELHWSAPSVSMQAAHTVNHDLPMPIPAPLPPAEGAHAIAAPEPAGNAPSISVPQVIPAPLPSVP